MQMCFSFYFYLFLTISQKKYPEGNGPSSTAVFCENLVALRTHDRRLWESVHGYPLKICGYGYG